MRKTMTWVLALLLVVVGFVVPGAGAAGAACAPAAVEVGDVARVEGTGGVGVFRFPVSVVVAPGCGVTGSVRYRTVDGAAADRDPALAGSDYTAVSGVLTWSGEAVTRYVVVPVAADVRSELVEVFWVSLDLPVGVVITGRSGAGWIEDDDSVVARGCAPGEPGCGGVLSTEGTGVCWRVVCPASTHFSVVAGDVRHVWVRTVDSGGPDLGYVPVEGMVLTVPPGARRVVVNFTITAPPGRDVRIPVEFYSPSSGVPGNMRTVLTLVRS